MVLPATRFFSFKRWLYQFVGFRFGQNVSIGNSITTYVLGNVYVGAHTWLGRNLDISVPKGTFAYWMQCRCCTLRKIPMQFASYWQPA